jgi:hypothetical protein
VSFVLSTWYRRALLAAGLLAATTVIASSAATPTLAIALASNESAISSAPPTPTIEQQLQIEQLRQETSWVGRLQGYLPAGSALAALTAVGWGVIVYLRDQRRNFQLRTQTEITNSLNRLVGHDDHKAVSSAEIISALTTLNALADQSANKQRLLNDVTNIITTAILDDIDFNDVSGVRFEDLCMRNWAPYETRLRENPGERGYILYRYLSALLKLHNTHSEYISKVSWDASNMKFIHPASKLMEPENDFRLFQRLVQGIHTHSQLIEDDSRRIALAQDFQAATGNAQLTQQLLGVPQS